MVVYKEHAEVWVRDMGLRPCGFLFRDRGDEYRTFWRGSAGLELHARWNPLARGSPRSARDDDGRVGPQV